MTGPTGSQPVVRLTDEHGLVALAEARPDGKLAPVVGLREASEEPKGGTRGA